MKRTNKIILVIALIALLSLFLVACQKYKIVDGIENIPEGSMQISVLTDENNATCASPYISWTHEEGAEDYIVQIASDEAFENIIESKIVNTNKYSVATTLNYSTQYYVRVIARQTTDGEKYASSIANSSFITTDKHNTKGPDYSQTRTLFDFENYTTESFAELFQPHAGGDTITAEIVEGAGVDGSKALKISSEKGSMGWSAIVCNLLPTDKKVWSGSTAIRLHIRAEEGTSANFSVKLGKRGYQTWSKSFIVKNEEGAYITIPYEVMADQGGGDGIWDLSIMTFMQFTFSGSAGTVYIDDITIGSTEEYQQDTTAEAARGIAPGILETFEGENVADRIVDGSDYLKFASVDNNFTEICDSLDNSGHEVRFKLMTTTSSFVQFRNVGYELKKYDYSQVDGITFKISLSHIKPGANILIKFGSYLNVYTATYSLEGATAGEYITVKIPFSELTIADGSSGALDYTKVDTLQIFVKESQYCYVTLDDIGFYKD